MVWNCDLTHEVQELFREAQRPVFFRIWPLVCNWTQRKCLLARLRYDREREANSKWYRDILAKARERSPVWRLSNPGRYRYHKDKITLEKMTRRAQQHDGLRCEECGKPVSMRSRAGQIPKFCSVHCNQKNSRRAYFRRKHPEQRVKVRSWGEKQRMGLTCQR
jgi:hypothetical protein